MCSEEQAHAHAALAEPAHIVSVSAMSNARKLSSATQLIFCLSALGQKCNGPRGIRTMPSEKYLCVPVRK